MGSISNIWKIKNNNNIFSKILKRKEKTEHPNNGKITHLNWEISVARGMSINLAKSYEIFQGFF